MIKIICLGKIKEKFFQEAINMYKLRISKYAKIEVIELPDCGYDLKTSLRLEYDIIMKVFNPNDYNILLDIEGEMLNSVELSRKIDKLFINHSNVTFIIGGSNGVLRELKEKCNYLLSFSTLTFPHQLFRVMLLEQIYRSYKILNNEEYHK